LRHPMRRADGSWRDSVYYSILAAEWPAVRARLEAAVGAPDARQSAMSEVAPCTQRRSS
jgi:hypothetical protein